MEQQARYNHQPYQEAPSRTDDLPLAFQRFYKEAADRDAVIHNDLMSSRAVHGAPAQQRVQPTSRTGTMQKITSIDIPFWRLVGFQMKFMLAACVSLGLMALLTGVIYMGSQEASASFPELWGQLTPYFETLQAK